MHLKSLTLRGFKSFASSTTLRFEPGITCVVGPNGSGKSNVVDALAWVMGEQGAKSLRGGKMEDVIFAGTSGRPPLGRAEVVLTIDNSDGALPIDFAEVTISRIMFRNGGSEYAINGESCRLLDVQELLSDSGIGREMHVIVGQGQLDAVLSATPEDRRGFIEEAAGVLKHRKRKEKALRKLDAMQANLTRIQDLNGELRRQLKPLGQQAEVARRAAVVQADQRDSRLRLLADDLLQLRTSLEAEIADESALRERRTTVEDQLAVLGRRVDDLESEDAGGVPAVARAQETYFRLAAVRDRMRSTTELAAQRVRHLAELPADERSGRDPLELDREAAQTRTEQSELASAVDQDRARLSDVVQSRTAADAALAAAEAQAATRLRAAGDRREGLARLSGEVRASQTRAETRTAEIERLDHALGQARARAERARADFMALESEVAGLDQGEVNLDDEHEQAAEVFAAAELEVIALREEERTAERDRAALAARVEALTQGLARKDGTGALLAAGPRLSGLLGAVAVVVTVSPGYQTAIAAALGEAADAVAVTGLDSAVDALELLKVEDAGRAGLLIGGAGSRTLRAASALVSSLPEGARPALDLVSAPPELRPALVGLLQDVFVVDDLTAAKDLVRSHQGAIAVTRAGDVLGHDHARGGSASTPSLLEVQAAVDEATEQLAAADHRAERARFELVRMTQVRQEASERVEAALSVLHESDARLAAVAEQLGQLGAAARAAVAEAARTEAALTEATARREADAPALLALEERLAAAQIVPDVAEDLIDERESLRGVLASAAAEEMDARLAVRTGEERLRYLAGRIEALDQAAGAERTARERAAERRARAARDVVVARAVVKVAEYASVRIEDSLVAAEAARVAAESARTARITELQTVRGRSRELAAELERLTDSVHRDEMARTEQRVRIEQLEAKAVEELGVEVEVLLAEYGPNQLVPPSLAAPGDVVDPEAPEPALVPYVRAEQEKRLRAAERALALLGRINPLALGEFEALEERHAFLTEQLEDLKKTRRDLLDIIREVDERVEQVFTAAFHDTAREFEGVFARLFPGGEGRLVLTDPADMLTTGIEVEARPPGKKIKRLSLLSGGERSLTAVALLVAIFKARPSPFYVMDEVEAALDDTNLGRLLVILEELRESSQLIVVTHQKRTMEIADALYGVSMRGDGVTGVISQRLRESEPA